MNKLTQFSENETLIVGKYYGVKCAIVEYGINKRITALVPAIGIPHKDEQFSVKYQHVHVDGRFTSGNGRHYDTDKSGRSNAIIALEDIFGISAEFKGFTVRRRKCKRLTTGTNPPDTAVTYMVWYKTFIGKSCAGKRCPHLGTHMLECDGQLVCPLHNLHGDIKSEKIIAL